MNKADLEESTNVNLVIKMLCDLKSDETATDIWIITLKKFDILNQKDITNFKENNILYAIYTFAFPFLSLYSS